MDKTSAQSYFKLGIGPKTPAIYVIAHKPSGSVYFGMARDCRKAFDNWHARLAKVGKRSNLNAAFLARYDQRANFEFKVLEAFKPTTPTRAMRDKVASLIGKWQDEHGLGRSLNCRAQELAFWLKECPAGTRHRLDAMEARSLRPRTVRRDKRLFRGKIRLPANPRRERELAHPELAYIRSLKDGQSSS